MHKNDNNVNTSEEQNAMMEPWALLISADVLIITSLVD